jgi:hypothetical protein
MGYSSTSFGEDMRKITGESLSAPGLLETSRQVDGTIYKVHESSPMIKAYSSDGSIIAGDRWIPLAHSPEEIIERFGTVRVGMGVHVTYSGPDGGYALASVMFNEGDNLGEEEVLPNDVSLGLWEIFTPGIGI